MRLDEFESRHRALERLSGGEGRGREEGFDDRRRAGGVVGGVVAVIVRVLGGG